MSENEMLKPRMNAQEKMVAAIRERAFQEAAAACIARARQTKSRARMEEAVDCANAILAIRPESAIERGATS